MEITQEEIEKYVLGHKLDSMTKKELIEVIIQHAQKITMLHIENDKKQERIDKAIEYINKNGILDLNGYDLLEILGSDKE